MKKYFQESSKCRILAIALYEKSAPHQIKYRSWIPPLDAHLHVLASYNCTCSRKQVKNKCAVCAKFAKERISHHLLYINSYFTEL